MSIWNIFAVHLLSIELKFVQYLFIQRFGFMVRIWKRKLCNSLIRWVDLPLPKEGYLAQNLGMHQSIFDLGTQMVIGRDSWREDTQRPRLNSAKGCSAPLQAFPKQKSFDSAGNCRKERHLTCVNSCSLFLAYLQVAFEENKPGSECEVA